MSEKIVLEKSQICVETRAKGMLAKLAHDLRIDIDSDRLGLKRGPGTLNLAGTLRGEHLKVAGVLKPHGLDRSVLSASDIVDIQKKIRSEVLDRPIEIAAECELTAEVPSSVRVTVNLTSRGKTTTASLSLTNEVDGEVVRARGSFAVLLTSLGITPPKGPLNAFRVDDEIRVTVDLTVRLRAAS